jgi:hypothetical protein
MFKNAFLFYFLILCFSCAELLSQDKPKLTYIGENITKSNIVIDYFISENTNTLNIALIVKKFGDDNFKYEPLNISGDIGLVSGSGAKTIIWNYKEELANEFNRNIYYFSIVDKNDESNNTGIPKMIGKIQSSTEKKSINAEETKKSSIKKTKNKNSNLIYWIGGGVLLAGGAAAYYFLKKKDNESIPTTMDVLPPDRPGMKFR